jgi:hypothetical protein
MAEPSSNVRVAEVVRDNERHWATTRRTSAACLISRAFHSVYGDAGKFRENGNTSRTQRFDRWE